MPYIKCPVCGDLVHLNVRQDLEAWYQERYPDLPKESLPPGRCFYCWQELTPGDSIVVRRLFGKEKCTEGDRGTLKAVLRGRDEGNLYEVELSSGKKVTLIRAELRKLRDDEH